MKKKLLIILLPFVIILGGIMGSFYYINNKIYTPLNQEEILSSGNDDETGYQEEPGVTNILLVGLDGRDKDSDSRTDSIIMATIDSNSKKVKLTSFMRDMYVPIPGHGEGKINSAFFFGGPELLIQTLNEDFNTNIQYYASIDFRAFQALVDELGGVDVEIKDYEVDEINKYIKEANWSNPQYISGAGYKHLNGQQALSYCRIRKVGNNDYERTERQRRVLGLMIEKARETSIFKLPELFTTILPYVKTNIQASKIMNLGYTVYKFGKTPVENLRIPADGMFTDEKVNGQDVLVPDFERNVALLEDFISSNGSATIANVPAYMANDFHSKDKPIDKRGVKRKTVEVHIDKNSSDNQNSNKNDKSKQIEGKNAKGQNTKTEKSNHGNDNSSEEGSNSIISGENNNSSNSGENKQDDNSDNKEDPNEGSGTGDNSKEQNAETSENTESSGQ